MKRFALAALLALGICASLPAQQPSLFMIAPEVQPSAALANGHFNFALVPELALPYSSANSFGTPTPRPALPDAPAPPPPAGFNNEGYRWNLAIGYEYVHFKAAPFSLNLSGLHTDVTYNLRDWFGLEANVVSAFGGVVYNGRSKYALYTAGGHIGWGPSNHRWSPWAHALVGGVHLNPQTAAGSKNGFAVQAGGGVDWALWPRVSLRGEADYIRTQLYSDSQNNFQIGAGAVIHF
jgi:opacity protein-like surface antigen